MKPKRPITPETLKKYSREPVCPVCGAYDRLSYSNLDVDGPYASQRVNCGKCKSTWLDNYEFYGINDLQDDDGEMIGEGDYSVTNYQEIVHDLLNKTEILPTLMGINPELDDLIEKRLKCDGKT